MIDFTELFREAKRMKPITRESVEEMRAKEPKRICFATIHTSEPKRSDNPRFTGTFNVPFGDGFKRIFPYELFPNPRDQYHEDAYWRSIASEEEFQEIESWTKQQGERVFLRDCLYASVALSLNFTDLSEGKRTTIGELEYLAKQRQDMDAVRELAKYCKNAILDLPLYKDADLLCAIPPRPDKEFDLPSLVTSIVSDDLGKPDITEHFRFNGEKKSVKSASLDEKWDSWEEAQLTFDGPDITDKTIILIDDKYQSGTTIQYVAMKLQEFGAYQVYGLSMVKTMRDTDNQ